MMKRGKNSLMNVDTAAVEGWGFDPSNPCAQDLITHTDLPDHNVKHSIL